MFRFLSLRRWLAGGVSVAVFLVVQAALPSPANAAVPGYGFSTSTGASLFSPPTMTNLHLPDDGTAQVSFRFQFSFYGQSYGSGYVSSNGNLQFDTNSAAFQHGCLPTGSALPFK